MALCRSNTCSQHSRVVGDDAVSVKSHCAINITTNTVIVMYHNASIAYLAFYCIFYIYSISTNYIFLTSYYTSIIVVANFQSKKLKLNFPLRKKHFLHFVFSVYVVKLHHINMPLPFNKMRQTKVLKLKKKHIGSCGSYDMLGLNESRENAYLVCLFWSVVGKTRTLSLPLRSFLLQKGWTIGRETIGLQNQEKQQCCSEICYVPPHPPMTANCCLLN